MKRKYFKWPQSENVIKNGNTLLDIKIEMAIHKENQNQALPKKVTQFKLPLKWN